MFKKNNKTARILSYYMHQQKSKVLVTVGTTEFEDLIKFTDSMQFISFMQQFGYKPYQITYQIGQNGEYVPQNGTHFRLSKNISQVYSNHQIIFTHGGAGTLLECLLDSNPRKRIIAVANHTLAGNHQQELVMKLHQQKYILGFTSVNELQNNLQKVKQFLLGRPQPYRQTKPKQILNHLIFGQDL